MSNIKIGDIVTRKSYSGDIAFVVTDILNKDSSKPVYVLRGLFYRIEADCSEDDLLLEPGKSLSTRRRADVRNAERNAHSRTAPLFPISLFGFRARTGKILHIDSSEDLYDLCYKHYTKAGLRVIGKIAPESQQPGLVRNLLEKYRPNILVVTGHDSMKKGGNRNSLESYRSSKYYIQSVVEARKYEPNADKLCVFSGACQSYYEAIIDAGANFASSPGRILINGLDPAIVSEKVAITDSRKVLNPQEVVKLTITGSDGIGGVNTRGQMKA